MSSVLDASCIINLDNGLVFEPALVHHLTPAIIEGLVYGECKSVYSLDQLIEQGRVEKISDNEVDTDLFLALLVEYELGQGETECITIAKQNGFRIACDDRKARAAAIKELGEGSVIGSLGVLRELVSANALSKEQAMAAYELMKAKGAFLPDFQI